MTVEDVRQLAEEVVACINILVQFSDALEEREEVADVERWISAAENVANRARECLEELGTEVDDWEFTVGLCTGGLFEQDDADDVDDELDTWT